MHGPINLRHYCNLFLCLGILTYYNLKHGELIWCERWFNGNFIEPKVIPLTVIKTRSRPTNPLHPRIILLLCSCTTSLRTTWWWPIHRVETCSCTQCNCILTTENTDHPPPPRIHSLLYICSKSLRTTWWWPIHRVETRSCAQCNGVLLTENIVVLLLCLQNIIRFVIYILKLLQEFQLRN